LLIWKDPWLSLSTPSTPIGPPTENNQNLKVSHLISPVSLDWDREKILQTLPELVDDILEIKLSSFGAKDYYAWLLSKDGIYNTKSGYFESLNGERLLEENHKGLSTELTRALSGQKKYGTSEHHQKPNSSYGN